MKKRPTGIAADVRTAIAQAERRGMTQYAIARAAGMPQSQVTRIARGESVPTLNTAERVLLAIGVKLIIVPIVAN